MLEAIEAPSADIVIQDAPLTIRREGKVVPLLDAVNNDIKDKPAGYFAAQVDVRGINYTVQVPLQKDIDTVLNFFTASSKTEPKEILRDINFSLLPYETTILLGRPRSGKTSLLDILGYRKKDNIHGTVSVNGNAAVSNYHRMVSYVQQGDIHMPLLTPTETFRFSAECQLDDRTKVERKVDEVLQVLSLKHAENTIVGDDMTRGISGGERVFNAFDRRVSIGVELVKESSFLLLDEPTTGLDSGAAYQIGQMLRANSTRGTPVLAALLQPSWELVNLFDKIILLSEGEIGYWGPINEALGYFDDLGFPCPAHYSAAEFLAEILDYPDRFPADADKPRLANTRVELIAAYRKSDLFARMLALADASRKPGVTTQNYPLNAVYTATHADKYPRSRFEQFSLLLRRGGLSYIRDWRRELETVVAMLFVSVVTGLLFLNRDASIGGSTAKLALLFLLILRGAFEALAGLVALFTERPVFYRQRAGHYHAVLPWVVSSFCVGVPAMVVQSVFYPTVVYWMADLRPDGGAFLYLIAQVLMMSLCFIAFVRFWGCMLPDPMLAATVTVVTAGILIIFSGFLIQRERIPAPWRWMFWLSPFSYAFSGVAISEFRGIDITCTSSELMPPSSIINFLALYPNGYEGVQVCPLATGVEFLQASGLHTDVRLKGVFFLATCLWTVVYISLFYMVVRYIDWGDFRMVTGTNDITKQLKIDAKVKSVDRAATLSWENLTYTVSADKGDKKILKDVSGYVKPGMLLALMGASGAGKTTLLDVLAKRKNVGKVSGKVLVDGVAPDSAFRRLIGYVEQTDMHFGQQTVIEALQFAAECRLPSTVSKESRNVIVTRVLDLLDLRPIAGAFIGYGGNFGGINAEERKRLSMGVELVAEPAILFLDEPTSGLDSNAADVVMAAIQKVAQSGTSVICTIHQPSTRIFNRATHLLLLKKGGQVVYFGEVDSEHGTLLSYFEKAGIISSPGQNPADLVLAASLGKAGRSEEEILSHYQQSNESKNVAKTIMSIKSNPPIATAEYSAILDELRKPYATSFGRQFVLHIHRWTLNYWRDPYSVITSVTRAVLLGIICGTVYYNRPYDPKGATERFSALFFSSLYADLLAFAYLPMVFFQRPIFYRERSERMYRTATYCLGYIMADIPMIFLGTLSFTISFYFWTGLQRTAGHFFFYLLMSQLNTMVSIMFVQMISAVFSRADTGGIIYSSCSLILVTAAGFLIPYQKIPAVVRWISWLSFSRYFIASVSAAEFVSSSYSCSTSEALSIPINATISLPYCDVSARGPIDILGVDLNVKWVGVGALAGFYCVFAVLYILALQFINHVKR